MTDPSQSNDLSMVPNHPNLVNSNSNINLHDQAYGPQDFIGVAGLRKPTTKMTTSYSTKQMDSKKLKKDLVLAQLQETRKDIMNGRIQLHEVND